MLGVGRDGVSALSIVECARANGLAAWGVAVSFDDLEAVPVPAILHTGESHFVVMEGVSRKGVRIVDPDVGRRCFRHANEIPLSGVAIVFESTPRLQRRGRRSAVMESLRPLISIGHLPGLATLGLVALFAACGAAALDAIGASVVLSDGGLLIKGSPRLPITWMAAVVGCVLAMRAIHLWIARRMGKRFVAAVSSHAQSEVDLWERNHRAQVLHGGVYTCDPGTSPVYPDLGRAMLVMGMLGAALLSDLRAGLSSIATMLIWAMALSASFGAAVILHRFDQSRASALREAQELLFRTLNRWQESRAPWEIPSWLARWRGAHRRATLHSQRLVAWTVGVRGIHVFVTFALGFAVLNARRAVNGDLAFGGIRPGELVALLVIFSAHQSRSVIVQILAWVAELSRFNETKSERESRPAARSAIASIDAGDSMPGMPILQLVNVSPSRSGSGGSLRVNIRLDVGDHVAIVGPHAVGKTMLVRTILGDLVPWAGAVEFGGRRLRDYPLAARAGIVAGFAHGDRLIDDSVAENLLVGNGHVPFERIRSVCELLGLASAVESFPLRYATPAWNDGRELSRSQRRLLLVARVLSSDAGVLVFDDPMSVLDPPTRRRVLAVLSASARTIIVTSVTGDDLTAYGFRLHPLVRDDAPEESVT